jgi:peptidyl-prolyl cis-trans isomerase C
MRGSLVAARITCCALACAAISLPAQVADAQTSAAANSQTVVATYHDAKITLGDIEAVIAIKSPVQRTRLAKPGGRERFLKELVDYELLVLEAERRGYGKHPAVEVAARERMSQALVEKELSVAPEKVDAAAVKAAYEAQRARFNAPELRRARHVLLATEAEATALIDRLKSEARNPTTALGTAARELSLDEASKPQSGDLGFFDASGVREGGRGNEKVAPELVKAVFAMRKTDEIAPKPVRSAKGYSVVLLLTVRPAVNVLLKDAEGELREMLAGEATRKATQALVDKLALERPVKKHPERVELVKLDAPASAGIPQGVPAAPADPREPPHYQAPDKY